VAMGEGISSESQWRQYSDMVVQLTVLVPELQGMVLGTYIDPLGKRRELVIPLEIYGRLQEQPELLAHWRLLLPDLLQPKVRPIQRMRRLAAQSA
jgi:hypothetical protein